VKGLFERRPVHMPSMPERVVHELGRLDVGRAPGAAVAERGSMLLVIEDRGAEDVVKQPVSARRKALARSRPLPSRCTHQLDVQSFGPRGSGGGSASRTPADDHDVSARPFSTSDQYWGTHRSAP
jgi:hypothetical protein